MLLTAPHRHNEFFQPVGRLYFFCKFKACPSCIMPLFSSIGAQGQVPFSLSACFLGAGGFPLDILYLVGPFFTIVTNSSLVVVSVALFATSCSRTYFSFTAAAASLSKYPSIYFMPTSSSPWFVSTSL